MIFGRRKTQTERVQPARENSHRLRVREITAASASSLLLRLEPASPGDSVPASSAGAHVDFYLGDGLTRQYSLLNAPNAKGHYLVCVQRAEDSRGGSAFVHDHLTVGAEVTASSPRNTFPLRDDLPRALLLAGGIGITPMVSMAEALHDSGSTFELHAYAKKPIALPLDSYMSSRPWADHVHRHFSNAGDSFRSAGPAELLEPQEDTAIYLCGPEGFLQTATERAVSAGWHADQIITERFIPAATPREGDHTFDVIARSTGQRMQVPPGLSIADVLEANGYDTLRSCGQGFCGSCVLRVVEGTPDHRDSYQTDDEHASNASINVCVSRSLTPQLELDV